MRMVQELFSIEKMRRPIKNNLVYVLKHLHNFYIKPLEVLKLWSGV